MKISPDLPVLTRMSAVVPGLNLERQKSFSASRNWSAETVQIFGHTLSIDLPTGNLTVRTKDVSYPYYDLPLGIHRTYDLQGQYSQLVYLDDYPNTDPLPYWFGNWQSGFEAQATEVWHNSLSDLQIETGLGFGGRFAIDGPDFQRGLEDASRARGTLQAYGIPLRTLDALAWEFRKPHFALRTFRGPFRILSGHFFEGTLVDNIDAAMWLFYPLAGVGMRIASEYSREWRQGAIREAGSHLLVTNMVDPLGHAIDLKPTSAYAPYKEFTYGDQSGRAFIIKLAASHHAQDPLNPGGQLRWRMVSSILDQTRASADEYSYRYNPAQRLETVAYPSELGDHRVQYCYEDPQYPGILTAIEDYQGNKIQFEYDQDPADLDERLVPRLKVKRIVDPEGIVIEYDYDHPAATAYAAIYAEGKVDRRIEYRYITDSQNTKQRFITERTIRVTRGFLRDASGALRQRQTSEPQSIRFQTKYTRDGRFNISQQIDPLQRVREYQYNDYNQIEESADFEGHRTAYTYDIPVQPSTADPRRYDLLMIKEENILRIIDPAVPGAYLHRPTHRIRKFEYTRYNHQTSGRQADHDHQSTHRVSRHYDARGYAWSYTYLDDSNANPLRATAIESPAGIKTHYSYTPRGELASVTDPEGNVYGYTYTEQGQLSKYTDPEQNTVRLFFYKGNNQLQRLVNQQGQATEFFRDPDGRLKTILDPMGDSADYLYYKNGRLHKIIQHRPATLQDPTNPHFSTLDFPNLETEYRYTPLGKVNWIKNARGLVSVIEFDEAGRIWQRYQRFANDPKIIFLYDEAGQLLETIDRRENATRYEYYVSGFLKSAQYPNWESGGLTRQGKRVDYRSYDYLGNLFSVEDSEVAGTTEYTYDEAGNLLIRTDPDGFRLQFTYDEDNRRFRAADPQGQFQLELNLDALGRPLTLQDSAILDGSMTWHYVYERSRSVPPRRRRLFERLVPDIGLATYFDYDERGRLTTLNHEMAGLAMPSIYSQEIVYRPDDMILRIRGSDATTFNYDSLKQLIFESRGNQFTDFDESGNLLYRADRTQPRPLPAAAYNAINQPEYGNNAPPEFTYDLNGNLQTRSISGGQTNFVFDGAGQLRAVKDQQFEVAYLYNHQGQLVQRAQKERSTGAVEITHICYLFSKPILIERDGNLLMLLTWDPYGDLLRIRRTERIKPGERPNSLFPLLSGQGNVANLVDASGAIRTAVTYDPWGDIKTLEDSAGLFDFWGYRGGFLDRKTNLLLMGARWYDPKAGRWISEDPIHTTNLEPVPAASLSLNAYAFAANNPIRYIDPGGLAPKELDPGETVKSIIYFSQSYLVSRQFRALERNDRPNWGQISRAIASLRELEKLPIPAIGEVPTWMRETEEYWEVLRKIAETRLEAASQAWPSALQNARERRRKYRAGFQTKDLVEDLKAFYDLYEISQEIEFGLQLGAE